MSKFFDGVLTEVFELQRDSLLLQIGVVEKNLQETLPFTEDRNELMKLYLFCDDKLKEVNARLDDISGKSVLAKKLNDEKSEECLNV